MDLLSALGTVAGKWLHILELWVLAAPWDEVYGRYRPSGQKQFLRRLVRNGFPGGSGWPIQAHQDLH